MLTVAKDDQREIAFAPDDTRVETSIAGQYSFLDSIPLNFL